MNDQKMIDEYKTISNKIRKSIIRMTYSTGNVGAHLGGSLSMVELLVTLYLSAVKYDVNNTNWENRDRVILSKGHGALALYPVLAEAGIIDGDELSTFKENGSRLGGHPSLNGLPGIEFATGSLGQGLSYGVGVCLALLRKNNNESRVFVILGDGECDEGSIWESAASASHFKLKNLVVIVDNNNIQYDGYTKDVLDMSPMEDKWRSFGWDTASIDGHDIGQILDAFSQLHNKPLVIIANTIKGKGISFMEGNYRYHNSTLNEGLYKKAMDELGEHID